MSEVLYIDDGLCVAEEEGGETPLREEKFIEKNHDSDALVWESQESFRTVICLAIIPT